MHMLCHFELISLQKMSEPKTAQLFITCLIDSFFPHIAEAIVRVLNRTGVRLVRGHAPLRLPGTLQR
jgi:hypothetical protein